MKSAKILILSLLTFAYSCFADSTSLEKYNFKFFLEDKKATQEYYNAVNNELTKSKASDKILQIETELLPLLDTVNDNINHYNKKMTFDKINDFFSFKRWPILETKFKELFLACETNYIEENCLLSEAYFSEFLQTRSLSNQSRDQIHQMINDYLNHKKATNTLNKEFEKKLNFKISEINHVINTIKTNQVSIVFKNKTNSSSKSNLDIQNLSLYLLIICLFGFLFYKHTQRKLQQKWRQTILQNFPQLQMTEISKKTKLPISYKELFKVLTILSNLKSHLKFSSHTIIHCDTKTTAPNLTISIVTHKNGSKIVSSMSEDEQKDVAKKISQHMEEIFGQDNKPEVYVGAQIDLFKNSEIKYFAIAFS